MRAARLHRGNASSFLPVAGSTVDPEFRPREEILSTRRTRFHGQREIDISVDPRAEEPHRSAASAGCAEQRGPAGGME